MAAKKLGSGVLETDRYGLDRIVWTVKNGEIYYSNTVLDLVDESSEIDRRAVSDYIDHGFITGARTWFDGIRVVGPGEKLSCRDGMARHETIWSIDDIRCPFRSRTEDEIIDNMYRLLMQSVERNVYPGERIGMQLSGGLDSRSILAAFRELYPDRDIRTFTFGKSDSMDVVLAAEVSRRADTIHTETIMDSENWFDFRARGIYDTDGELTLYHAHTAIQVDTLAGGADCNLSGFAGDVVYRDSQIKEEPEEWIIHQHLRRFAGSGDRLISKYIDNRRIFYDSDLFDYGWTVTIREKHMGQYYQKMLLKYFPKYFYDIPWQRSTRTISGAAPSVDLAGISHSFHDYGTWILNPEMVAFVDELLLSGDALYRKYLDAATVEDQWREHKAGGNTAEKVAQYMTFEIWLQKAYNGKEIKNLCDGGGFYG